MAIRRTDIDIILPGVTYQEKMAIPVWDAYIEKVVIDGDIPRLITDRISGKINSMINGYPQKFSGQLKGSIENLLNETEVYIYKKIGELFIFGIICILVVTITIIIIKPYA